MSTFREVWKHVITYWEGNSKGGLWLTTKWPRRET